MPSKKQQLHLKTALCLLLVFAGIDFETTADAAQLRYYQGQDAPILSLTMPISSVGSLSLPNGQVELSENEVRILAIPEGLFDSRVILSGVVVNTSPLNAKSSSLRALVYFYGGNWLNSLHFRPVSELIRAADGKVHDGQIVEGDDKTLSLRRPDKSIVTFNFREISTIDSPRAFWLDVPLRSVQSVSGYMVGQAYAASFEPTAPTQATTIAARPMLRPLLLGDEHGLKNSSFAAYLAADVAMFLTPIIATPIVFTNQYLSQKNLLNQANSAASLQSAQVQSLINRFGP